MQSEEIGDGAVFDELELGSYVSVHTTDATYIIERREEGLWISGHPEYCPEPTRVFTALYRSMMKRI